MGDFDSGWLALREPADHAARSTVLHKPLLRALVGSARSGDARRIVDLGAGTASNLRYLARRLPYDQLWHCYESDPALLARGPEELTRWAHREGFEARIDNEHMSIEANGRLIRVHWHQVDLESECLESLLERCDLVTCSALLDLVSAHWLERLLSAMQRHRCIGLFVLTYDGRIDWRPALDADRVIVEALNADQKMDKGFGAALGPGAISKVSQSCSRLGFRVTSAASPWLLDSDGNALHERMLLDLYTLGRRKGIDAEIAEGWYQERRALLDSGARMTVGHGDLLVEPVSRPGP